MEVGKSDEGVALEEKPSVRFQEVVLDDSMQEEQEIDLEKAWQVGDIRYCPRRTTVKDKIIKFW